jgi:hypothetical protein
MSDNVHHLLRNAFADTVLTLGVGQMTDDLPELHAMLVLATNGNPPMLIANEILVGNSGFCGFTHTERKRIYRYANCPLKVYWENSITGNCSYIDKNETGD